MKRTLIALLALASTSAFAQSATINGEERILTSDTVVNALPPTCDTLKCFFGNTTVEYIVNTDYTKVLVRNTQDATELCDFARSIDTDIDFIVYVLTSTGSKTIGRCK